MTFYSKKISSLLTEFYSNVHLIKHIIQARYFIHQNFSSNITLDDICREACISKFYLIRSFKNLYGRTPNQYLTSVRIARSKELLRTKASVMEVCFSVGFDSPTSFTGLFKKHVGLSPDKFRKSTDKKAILKKSKSVQGLILQSQKFKTHAK